MTNEINPRIESELEIKSFLQNLKYALENDVEIKFQVMRIVDDRRNEKYTNQYTINTLFPNENPLDVLKQELLKINVEDYIQTVKDFRFPKRSEMRVFGKVYDGSEDVYIKIRVELLGQSGDSVVFVMSFHFAERAFTSDMFPYRK